jgi:hypothetical protein
MPVRLSRIVISTRSPRFFVAALKVGRLITITDSLHLSLHRSMKAIGNHVQEHTRNLLREDIDLTSKGIKRAF